MDVRLALTGFGNVGQGVATLLRDHAAEYRTDHGVNLIFTGVADRGGAAIAPAGLDPEALLRAKQAHGTVAGEAHGETELAGTRFLQQSEADILLETASTNYQDGEPGWSYIRAALQRDMHIVLASKGALVLHYAEIMAQARERQVGIRFGGTVGAPLPVLEITEGVLIGARITSVAGILNGTTNQILTAMARGASYDEGVRQAQEIGIAETDPTLDVDGWDAAAKAVIVANAVLGGKLQLSDVGRTGIRDITAGNLEEAGRQGETIKLIARVRVDERAVWAEVKPERHPVNSFFGRLDGATMVVSFRTEPLGDLNLSIEESGSGVSGGISTALTVLRDVVNLTRQPGLRWSTRQ